MNGTTPPSPSPPTPTPYHESNGTNKEENNPPKNAAQSIALRNQVQQKQDSLTKDQVSKPESRPPIFFGKQSTAEKEKQSTAEKEKIDTTEKAKSDEEVRNVLKSEVAGLKKEDSRPLMVNSPPPFIVKGSSFGILGTLLWIEA